MVTYSNGGKYAYFDGLRFCRDARTGYYLNSTIHKRLHRFVYERVNGDIPAGFQVHHKDHNKDNNEPENLELLTAKQHRRRHADEMTDDLRHKLKNNMIQKAIPAAAKWHKTELGHEWHKRHYEVASDALRARVSRICKQCGKPFDGILNDKNVYCSNACRSAHRREAGIDNEYRKCVVCGAMFSVNRYSGTKCCSRSCAARLRGQNLRDQKTAAETCV